MATAVTMPSTRIRGIEAQQRSVIRSHRVVERMLLFDPDMGDTAARHRGRGERTHRIGGRLLLVVGDDRRSVVEVAEVEAPATLLLRVERVGQLSSGGTRSLADCIQAFTSGDNSLPLHHHCLASDVGGDNAREACSAVIGWRSAS